MAPSDIESQRNGVWVGPSKGGTVDVEISYENPEQLGLPLTLTRGGAFKMAFALARAALTTK